MKQLVCIAIVAMPFFCVAAEHEDKPESLKIRERTWAIRRQLLQNAKQEKKDILIVLDGIVISCDKADAENAKGTETGKQKAKECLNQAQTVCKNLEASVIKNSNLSKL